MSHKPYKYREFTLVYRNKHGETVERYLYATSDSAARDLWETSDYSKGATLLWVMDKGPIDTSDR